MKSIKIIWTKSTKFKANLIFRLLSLIILFSLIYALNVTFSNIVFMWRYDALKVWGIFVWIQQILYIGFMLILSYVFGKIAVTGKYPKTDYLMKDLKIEKEE